MKKKIIIAEQNAPYRKVLKQLLGSSYEVHEAVTEEQLHLILAVKPDVIIYDLYFSEGDFKDSMDKILKISPLSHVLVQGFEDRDNTLIPEFCISQGAKGYLDKGIADINVLIDAIERITKGETVIELDRTI